MNGLLSMIGMQTELEYQMGDDFPFGSPRIRFNVPKGNIPSDKQKVQRLMNTLRVFSMLNLKSIKPT